MLRAPFRQAVLVWCLVLACACGQTLTVTDTPELTLRAAASVSHDTKADPELTGASLGTDNAYVILASASATSEPEFMTGQLFTYSSAEAKWQSSSAAGTGIQGPYSHEPVFWPMRGIEVDFLALALKPAAYDALTTAPGGLSFFDAAHGGSGAGVTVSEWDTFAHPFDLLYAVKNGQSVNTHPGG
ncbi:MAG: hypothetical protein K6E35_07235, partial [Bacteroidales bacterium]|nr:hypothetical protein [Bacteroidales bacterium]